MLGLFKARLPGRRAILSVVVVLVLSYSAFIVGNAMRPQGIGEGGSVEVYWDDVGSPVTVTGRGYRSDAVTAVAATAESASLASADAASASRSSKLFSSFLRFNDVAELNSEITDIEDVSAGRMVVFTAYLGLEVDDIDASLDQIKLISVMHSGFISNVNTRDERGSISLRVPQSKFHEALTDLEELGEVTTRDLMGEDVTEEYVDLEAQLVTLQHQESRLFEIMEMGTTVDAVLKVERELERVRGRIESIQGRIKYLDDRVDLSTITVNLREIVEEEEILVAWFPSVDWGVPVRHGLSVLFTVAQGMITMVIILTPFIALGYVGIRVFKRYWKSVPPPVEEEIV